MKGVTQNQRALRAITFFAFFFTTAATLRAQEEKQLVIGQQPVYKVARAKQPITIPCCFYFVNRIITANEKMPVIVVAP